MSRTVIKVVAAVIERDGKILVGQRKRDDTHPLKWEFPGGKVERGESPVRALHRELLEELAIEATIGPALVRHRVEYPGRATILLTFYRVVEFTGTPQNLAFEQIMWAPPDLLPTYDFLEGDVDLVKRFASGEFARPGAPLIRKAQSES